MISHNAVSSIDTLAFIREVDFEWLSSYIQDILEVSKSISFHDNRITREFSKDFSGVIQVRIFKY